MGKVFDSRAGYVTVPNPDLKAEYAYNTNFGVTKLLGKRGKINANLYYTYLQNAMVRRDFIFNGQDSILYDGQLSKVEAIQNAANAYVYGVDAELNYKLSHHFLLALYCNRQVGREELDELDALGKIKTSPLRHSAPFFSSASITYAISQMKIHIYANYAAAVLPADMPEEEKGKPEIYAIYAYDIDADGKLVPKYYCPEWFTFNFKAEYKINNNLSICVGLENILDRRYRSYSSGIVAPGRNFILSLQTNF